MTSASSSRLSPCASLNMSESDASSVFTSVVRTFPLKMLTRGHKKHTVVTPDPRGSNGRNV